MQFTAFVYRSIIANTNYFYALSAASRFWSKKLCKVMNIDENDIRVAARDLIRCFQYTAAAGIKIGKWACSRCQGEAEG